MAPAQVLLVKCELWPVFTVITSIAARTSALLVLVLYIYRAANSFAWLPHQVASLLQLTGTYFGTNSDYTDAPDFYGLFCGEHGKPMIIGETGALWNLCDKFPNQTAARAGGCTEQTAMPDELDVKQTWWQQVLGGTHSSCC